MEKKKKILLGLIIVLSSIPVLTGLYCLFHHDNVVRDVVVICVSASLIYYALKGYKEPHGNLLKQIMLLYGVSLTTYIMSASENGDKITIVMYPVVMMLVTYISGRLDRAKENRLLSVSVTFALLFSAVNAIMKYGGTGFIANHMLLYPLLIWLALCCAYDFRYEEHKQAGSKD